MPPIDRRHMLASLGVLGSSGLLAGCGQESAKVPRASGNEQEGVPEKCFLLGPPNAPVGVDASWEYLPLDAAAVGETAYRIYPEGSCMYAVVGSVMQELAAKDPVPFSTFPYQMMRYGQGGLGGWGSLCGVVNGGAALIGLFCADLPKETLQELIGELCSWYEATLLPAYTPHQPWWASEVQPSVAESLLCHVSVSNWCEATGRDAFCMHKKERCRRLAADGAMKTVEILNRKAEHGTSEFTGLTPEVNACIKCHGRDQRADITVKMNCASCHQFDGKHPE